MIFGIWRLTRNAYDKHGADAEFAIEAPRFLGDSGESKSSVDSVVFIAPAFGVSIWQQ